MNRKQFQEIKDGVRQIKEKVFLLLKKCVIRADMTTENMARVGTLRGGLGLFIGSIDHGNPHIEVKRNGKHRVAKIFFYPNIAEDPAVRNELTTKETEEVKKFISDNILRCRTEWYRIHKDNSSAQMPFNEKGEVVK
jgi:hypothetical protein